MEATGMALEVRPDDLYLHGELAHSSAPLPSQDNRTRWLVCVGETPRREDDPLYPAGFFDMDTQLLHRGRLHRCVLMPVVGRKVPQLNDSLPEGLRMEDDPDRYMKYAGPEVVNLLKLYSRFGLVEVPEMIGMSPEEGNALHSTAVFFPHWPQLPPLVARNDKQPEIPSIEDEVGKVISKIQGSTLSGVAAEQRPYLLAIGRALLQSCKQTGRYYRETIQSSNIALEVKDDRRKPTYDELDDVAFLRTGLTRRNEALDNLAAERRVDVYIEPTEQRSGLSREDLEEVISAAKADAMTPDVLSSIISQAVAQGIAAGKELAMQPPAPTEAETKTTKKK